MNKNKIKFLVLSFVILMLIVWCKNNNTELKDVDNKKITEESLQKDNNLDNEVIPIKITNNSGKEDTGIIPVPEPDTAGISINESDNIEYTNQ